MKMENAGSMNIKIALRISSGSFYALAVLSAIAIAAPIKWPKSSAPLVIVVIFLGAVALGAGCYIAYAGGKIRHREFRNEPAPPKRAQRRIRSGMLKRNANVILSEARNPWHYRDGRITSSFDSAAIRSKTHKTASTLQRLSDAN